MEVVGDEADERDDVEDAPALAWVARKVKDDFSLRAVCRLSHTRFLNARYDDSPPHPRTQGPGHGHRRLQGAHIQPAPRREG